MESQVCPMGIDQPVNPRDLTKTHYGCFFGKSSIFRFFRRTIKTRGGLREIEGRGLLQLIEVKKANEYTQKTNQSETNLLRGVIKMFAKKFYHFFIMAVLYLKF